MKDHPNRLKKWLLSYFALSILLFSLGHIWSWSNNPLGLKIAKPLIINGSFLIITLFFYIKITQKSIGWILSTLFLATFLSFIFSFITSTLNHSEVSFVNYIVFSFFWITFNTVFMFAGVFSEQKKPIKSWGGDILDDSNF